MIPIDNWDHDPRSALSTESVLTLDPMAETSYSIPSSTSPIYFGSSNHTRFMDFKGQSWPISLMMENCVIFS